MSSVNGVMLGEETVYSSPPRSAIIANTDLVCPQAPRKPSRSRNPSRLPFDADTPHSNLAFSDFQRLLHNVSPPRLQTLNTVPTSKPTKPAPIKNNNAPFGGNKKGHLRFMR